MKNEKIKLHDLTLLPYTPNSKAASQFPAFELFHKRQDYLLIDHITRLAMMFRAENLFPERSRGVNESFRAVVFSPQQEIVSSKDFSIRMDSMNCEMYHRIDMPLFKDDLCCGDYTVSVFRSDSTDGEPVISAPLCFFALKRLPLRYFTAESACLVFDGREHTAVDVASQNEVEVRMTFSHSFLEESRRLPEFSVRIIKGSDDDSQDIFPAEIQETDNCHFTLTSKVTLPDDAPETMMVQIRAFNLRLTGFVFLTDLHQEGILEAEDIVYIPDFTSDKGLEEIRSRTDRRIAREKAEKDEKAADELNNLTGLANIKEGIKAMTDFITFNRLRSESGLPGFSRPLHSLFLGAPGTGKTTVAKLMGKLLHKAGALSRGQVVFRERATLVGKYYNSESENIREALEESDGGILFIDEAYQLYQPEDPKDPGMMVLNSLLTILADPEKRDWMLILAGYTEPMLEMLRQNPGLNSRFSESNRHTFKDFTVDELEEIAMGFLKKYGLILTKDAGIKLKGKIMADYENRDESFGNARYIMNLMETEIIPAMASRIASSMTTPSKEILSTVIAEDIPLPLEVNRRPNKSVGFNLAA